MQVASFAVLAEGLANYSRKKLCGYNEFNLFFRKIKNTDPLMDAKFKSKKHLLYTIFDFFLNQKRYQICWNSFTKMHQRKL
jgi:hypothetical protein